MWWNVLPWVFLAGFAGAGYGAVGYDAETYAREVGDKLPGIVSVAWFGAFTIVVLILAMPVVNRLNDGRCDWRKVRAEAPPVAILGALGIGLMFAGIGGYRLAGELSGGWAGGWRAAGAGTLVGAALGVPIGLVAALLLRFADRVGARDPRVESGAAAGRAGG
jgi:energy-converting hydrogenase Eha subunit A